jgi:hypothetical protein
MMENSHKNGEQVLLTYDEAVARLPRGERIHTFVQAGPMLIGADWDREQVLALFRANEDAIHESGEQAQGMNHGIAVLDAERDGRPVFIETKGGERW